MKKKRILIPLAVIAAIGGIFYLYSFYNSLVHGYIEIDPGDNQIKAELKLRKNLFGSIIIKSDSEPTLVKSRILKPSHLKLENQKYTLQSYGPWGNFSKIKLTNNEKTKIEFGSPFTVKPRIRKSANLILIDFSIIGRAGEYYLIPVLAKAPEVKIVDEEGKTLASGKFSYG